MLMRYLGPRRFVFIANSKAASTAIENSRLASHAQIRMTMAGRHLPLSDVVSRFDVVFARDPLEDFLTFGVIRDPVEWLVSWFNFRSRPELGRPGHGALHYAGDMSFEEFWDRYRGSPPYAPQSTMFCGPVERVDVLIPFERLDTGLREVGEVLGIRRLRIVRENPSRLIRIRAGDVPTPIRDEIRDAYRADYELIGRLEEANEAGLRRYAARTRDLDPPAGVLARKVARAAKGTRLEDPLKAIAARLGIPTPGAREIARPDRP